MGGIAFSQARDARQSRGAQGRIGTKTSRPSISGPGPIGRASRSKSGAFEKTKHMIKSAMINNIQEPWHKTSPSSFVAGPNPGAHRPVTDFNSNGSNLERALTMTDNKGVSRNNIKSVTSQGELMCTMRPLAQIRGKEFFEKQMSRQVLPGKNKPTINSVRSSLERNFHPRVGSNVMRKDFNSGSAIEDFTSLRHKVNTAMSRPEDKNFFKK